VAKPSDSQEPNLSGVYGAGPYGVGPYGGEASPPSEDIPPELSDEEALEQLLSGKPQSWWVVLAVRGALRVLPFINTITPDHLLLLFRALAATRFAVGFSNDIAFPGAVEAAETLMPESQRGPVSAAVYHAASTTYASDERDAVLSLLNSTFNDSVVFQAKPALLADYDLLINNQATPAQLAKAKLWSESAPPFVNETWRGLAANLIRSNEHWPVWIGWYNSVVDGSLLGEAWEAAFTDAPGELPWGAGPKSVNDAIAARLKSTANETQQSEPAGTPPDARDREAFQLWLTTKPASWSRAIAVRAALRALPRMSILERRLSAETAAQVVLPVFRGAATARLAIIHADSGYDNIAPVLARAVDAIVTGALIEVGAPSDAAVGAVLAATRSALIREAAATAAAAADAASKSATGAHALINALAVRQDAQSLNDGELAVSDVVVAPLWPSQPPWPQQEWQKLADDLLHVGSHWKIWIAWYEQVLKGLPAGHVPHSQEEFTDIPAPLPWEDGPEEVNAEIARRLALREPEHQSQMVPAQRPAAVEPVWENGVLTLPKISAITDLQDQQFAAALRGLSAEILTFADDLAEETNIDRRFVSYVRKLADRIPPAPPTQEELFRIGHVEAAFQTYAKTVNEQWPDFLASRYHALILHFDRTMRQSPSWREFKRNAAKETLTPEQIAAAGPLAKEAAAALRQDDAKEFVDPNVPQAIERLADSLTVAEKDSADLPVEVIESGKELLAIDLIESVNNALKPIAEAVLSTAADAGTEYAKGVKKGLVRAAKRQGPKDGEKLFKWLRRVAISGGVSAAGWSIGLSHLLEKFPDAFGWLTRVLHL
jgi:hypothetical protein